MKYIIRRIFEPTDFHGMFISPDSYAELIHLPTMDDAIIKLFQTDLNSLERVTAKKSKLGSYPQSTAILNAENGARLMYLCHRPINLPGATANQLHPSKMVLVLDVEKSKGLLSQELRNVLNKHIENFNDYSYVPMAMFGGKGKRLVPANPALTKDILHLAAPSGTLKNRISYALRIHGISMGEYRILIGTPVRHIIPSDFFTNLIPGLFSVDLEAIGKTVDARITDSSNAYTLAGFLRKANSKTPDGEELRLEFGSTVYRNIVERSFPLLAPLTKHKTALSIRVGQYDASGKLSLTKEFNELRNTFLKERLKKKTVHNKRVSQTYKGRQHKK